jgi:hypothetical protein
MDRSPVSSSPSKGQPTITGDISTPPREELLIETLRDASLTWSSSRSHQFDTWKSEAPGYLGSPGASLDDGWSPRVHCGLGHSSFDNSFSRIESFAGFSPSDWHTVATETLCTTTDAHEVTFTKTRVNGYSHQFGLATNHTSYAVEFRSLDDKDQRVRVEESQCRALAEIFHEIAKRIN